MNSPSSTPKRLRFTLIELLVVIAVISILAAILLPAIRKVVAMSELTECTSNLRQVGLAMHYRANDYKGRFPVNKVSYSDKSPAGVREGWNFNAREGGRRHLVWDLYYDYGSRNLNLSSKFPEPSVDQMLYLTDYRVFNCPVSQARSEWRNEAHDGYGGKNTAEDVFFKEKGYSYYFTTLIDRPEGGKRDKLLGCHKWAPTPEHPTHTWMLACPGHNAVEGLPATPVAFRKVDWGKWVEWRGAGWGSWPHGSLGNPHYPDKKFRTWNVLYVDTHIKYHGKVNHTSQAFSLGDYRYWAGLLPHVNDGCHHKRGNSCTR